MLRERAEQRGGDSRPHESDLRREGSDPRRDFEREVRRLKKDFQKNVLPAVKRHSSYVSKSEMRRVKERKAAAVGADSCGRSEPDAIPRRSSA